MEDVVWRVVTHRDGAKVKSSYCQIRTDCHGLIVFSFFNVFFTGGNITEGSTVESV